MYPSNVLLFRAGDIDFEFYLVTNANLNANFNLKSMSPALNNNTFEGYDYHILPLLLMFSLCMGIKIIKLNINTWILLYNYHLEEKKPKKQRTSK